MASKSNENSTIVRAIPPLRLLFRLGEYLAPSLAAKAVTHMWFRLPAPPETRHRAVAPAAADPFELDCLGGTISGYDWGSGPILYFVHGWGGCAGDFDSLAASAVASGYRVIAFDAPSHGNSADGPYGPRASSPLHIAAAFNSVAAKFGEPYAVIAHSLGCLAAVTVLRETVHPEKVVFIAPFIGGRPFTQLFAGQLGAGPRTLRRFAEAVEERSGRSLEYFAIPQPSLDLDTLIVHDRHDRFTPLEHAEIIADAWPHARLRIVEKTGHRRILRNPEVIGQVRAFLDGE